MPRAHAQYDALALFSGGLDSILAVKVLQEQGLRVLGLHFESPFFGKSGLIPHWRAEYGIEAVAVDVRQAYVDMLRAPAHGYGKHLNPCRDCKILMLRQARELLPSYGARFLVSGEVLGQRPMSQRADALNLIRKGAGVKDLLLRPLSAGKLAPTPMEESGLVDRSRLPAIWGRGRTEQLALAARFGITDIPTPAGGCGLAEAEPAARYAAVLRRLAAPAPADFALAQLGRQYWAGPLWLAIGRNQGDNEALEAAATEADIVLRLRDMPGPLALCRQYAPAAGADGEALAWTPEALADAAAFVASYAPRARAEAEAGRPVAVSARRGGQTLELSVAPARKTRLAWAEPKADTLAAWKRRG